MSLENLQILTLLTSLVFLVAQLLVKNKQTTHILFAVFCGSISMSLAKDISGDTLGPFQYLIGLGACAICNCYWLLSRSLFRGPNGICVQHLLLAAAIALLIMLNQGYLFAQTANLLDGSPSVVTTYMLREITVLLSSCILVLSFWEGCRGFSGANKQEQAQRLLFLSTFCGAVIFSRLAKGSFADDPTALNTAITAIILFVLVNTQALIIWRNQNAHLSNAEQPEQNLPVSKPATIQHKDDDGAKLAEQIKTLIVDQALFLQPSLKVADLARQLDVSEYRISDALRYHTNAPNFNQFINEYRIQYAKAILSDPDKRKWSVLVVSTECGFASVGPFTRAFKATTGCTPNQYRQNHLQPITT